MSSAPARVASASSRVPECIKPELPDEEEEWGKGPKTMLPPISERLFSGNMAKQVVTTRGIKWSNRFCCLMQDHLTFSKHFEKDGFLSPLHIPLHELRDVFDKHDYSRDGMLQYEEARDAMKTLNLYSTDSTFHRIFRMLDTDMSGDLDWHEFQALATRQTVSLKILDFIPLEEIVKVDFEIQPKASIIDDNDQTDCALPASPLRTGGTSATRGKCKDEGPADDGVQGADERDDSASFSLIGAIRFLVDKFESLTGIDLDGDGNTEKVSIPDYNDETHELTLIVSTVENGHNLGRVYIHVVPPETASDWVLKLTNASKSAQRRKKREQLEQVYGHSAWALKRAQAAGMYNSFSFQMLTFSLIMLGFVLDMAEAQVLPQKGSSEESIFFIFDATITAVFTLELLLNLFAHSNHGFKPFTSKPANWFDAAIVLVSLANVILASWNIEMPNAKLLRLLRIGRIVRLFSTLKDFQKLITAMSAAILPVCNAFAILLVIAAVYAILGTNLFHADSPEYFATFHTSLFTMFQVLSGDSWASGVARSIFATKTRGRDGLEASDPATDPLVALFFVSYILIASVMLLNVVVAVLLDEFVQSVTRAKEEEELRSWTEKEKRKATGCLDPLTQSLVTFDDEEDLDDKIDGIFSKLDEDSSGGLCYEEFRQGLKDDVMSLGFTVGLTLEDFDVMTENGRLVTAAGEFDRAQFHKMMRGELWRYSRRALNNVLCVTGDDQFRSTILMLKLMDMTLRASLADIAARMPPLNTGSEEADTDAKQEADAGAAPQTNNKGVIEKMEARIASLEHRSKDILEKLNARVDKGLEDLHAADSRQEVLLRQVLDRLPPAQHVCHTGSLGSCCWGKAPELVSEAGLEISSLPVVGPERMTVGVVSPPSSHAELEPAKPTEPSTFFSARTHLAHASRPLSWIGERDGKREQDRPIAEEEVPTERVLSPINRIDERDTVRKDMFQWQLFDQRDRDWQRGRERELASCEHARPLGDATADQHLLAARFARLAQPGENPYVVTGPQTQGSHIVITREENRTDRARSEETDNNGALVCRPQTRADETLRAKARGRTMVRSMSSNCFQRRSSRDSPMDTARSPSPPT